MRNYEGHHFKYNIKITKLTDEYAIVNYKHKRKIRLNNNNMKYILFENKKLFICDFIDGI